MKAILPFKHEEDKNLLNKIHPLVRLILPFIWVIPFLILNDIYLVLTIILINIIFSIIFRLNLLKTIQKLKIIIPFIILITIFLPIYIGHTILLHINIGLRINVYLEGLNLALLLFFRVFGAALIFLTYFSSLTYSEFIEALTKIRIIPSFFVGSIIIMLHYIPILAQSNRKILNAQELRGKKITTYRQQLKTHAFIMGKNLISNMERSEKLYESLKMRGFSGKITIASKKLKIFDIIIISSFIIVLLILVYFIDLKLFYIEVIRLFLP